MKSYILRAGGYPNRIIFGAFFEGALKEVLGTLFFAFWSDFGFPVGAHVAPKRHQKQGAKKVTEKVILSTCEPRGPGPFKQEKSDNQTPDNASNTPWRAWRHGGGFSVLPIQKMSFKETQIFGPNFEPCSSRVDVDPFFSEKKRFLENRDPPKG